MVLIHRAPQLQSGGSQMSTSAEAVLAQLPTACLRVGRDGVVQWSNARAQAVLGEVTGSRWSRCSRRSKLLESTARSGSRNEVRRQTPAGELEFGYQVSELDDEFIVVFQNITGFQKLRSERDRLMQLAAVGDVLPSVLHELKNPLAAVRTAVEVLIEDHPNGELAEQLHAVLNEIRRMGLVLDGVGRMKHELPSTRHFAIDQAVREAFAVLVPQAQGRGIRTSAIHRDAAAAALRRERHARHRLQPRHQRHSCLPLGRHHRPHPQAGGAHALDGNQRHRFRNDPRGEGAMYRVVLHHQAARLGHRTCSGSRPDVVGERAAPHRIIAEPGNRHLGAPPTPGVGREPCREPKS
jgi:hypothetical protein